MPTAKLFSNGSNQAIRIPKELEFTGVKEVLIRKDGNSLVITPAHKSWLSFTELERADTDFTPARDDLIDPGRVTL